MNIQQAKGLEVYKAQGFFIIISTTYNHYIINIIMLQISTIISTIILRWNWIQVDIQIKKGSNVIYSAIPKSWEWLTINCVINIVGGVLLWFCIFKGERLHDDYIKLYKLGICITMQKIVQIFFSCSIF